MTKALAGLLISAVVLVPAIASAKSSPRPSKDTTPPSVTSVHIQSSNANPSKAKAGDTVTLTFTASEKVTPVVLVETKTLFVKARNTTGNSWEASYVVNAKDRTGRVDYLITLADASNNISVCSSVRLPLIKYCPTTDGSSVTIYKETTQPPADTQAPTIAAHADVYATTTGTSAEVSYALPVATDNVDATVVVSCSPASGSAFSVGTTTVTCSAQDAAGNPAQSTFKVVVTQEVVTPPDDPEPYTMATQSDESYLCGAVNDSWRYCDAEGSFGFTDNFTGIKTIELGLGSEMGEGVLQTVTIAKDPSEKYGETNLFHPWDITITCYTDAAHTSVCGDWSEITDDANESSDGKYWTADFSSLERTFNQGGYYVMTINDTGWETPAYGSESKREPYWVIKGVR